jgi:hypothetical protein
MLCWHQLDVKEEQTLGHVLDGHWYYRSKGLALDAILRGRSFRALLENLQTGRPHRIGISFG